MGKGLFLVVGAIFGAALGFAMGFGLVWGFGAHLASSFRFRDVNSAAIWAGIAVAILGFFAAPMFAAEVFDD